MTDELERWAAERAPKLLARAEAEAVAALRDALVEAALAKRRGAEAATERPTSGGRPASRPAVGDVLWAYCVLPAGGPLPEDLEGVAGGRVELVRDGDLAVLVSRVPLAEYGPEPLRDNLNRLDWLERVARDHEAVLERALHAGTIVPLRLCTIYESEPSVRGMLERERDTFAEALERLAGRQEWGVKLIVDGAKLTEEARARSPEATTVEDELDTRTGGGAYMLRRRLDRHVREAAHQLATEVAEQVHARLQDWAIDAVTHPPQNRELSGHEGEMLLNGAYLVEAERVDGLRELVAELEGRHRALGARLELTGPWPPYNFVPRGGAAAIE